MIHGYNDNLYISLTKPGYNHMKMRFLSFLFLFGSVAAQARTPERNGKEDQKVIYFFSGLGADSIPFTNLKLPGYRKVYINWIPPLPDESLKDYASRIKDQICNEKPYIIGLSFGGVLAVEVSKQVEIGKMILISSARTRNDLNHIQNFFMRLGLYRIIPGTMVKHTNFLTHLYFGARTERDKKALMRLLQGTDITLFRWGLKSIAQWDNTEPPPRTIQVHGTADRVIAYRRIAHPDFSIPGGGHLMVLNKADTISRIITGYFNGSIKARDQADTASTK